MESLRWAAGGGPLNDGFANGAFLSSTFTTFGSKEFKKNSLQFKYFVNRVGRLMKFKIYLKNRHEAHFHRLIETRVS